jgi:hypothetical protein
MGLNELQPNLNSIGLKALDLECQNSDFGAKAPKTRIKIYFFLVPDSF